MKNISENRHWQKFIKGNKQTFVMLVSKAC